ncbi:Hypothetical_protein [Hexamita inflata]|uniref:Hypothetical_protein n=1 Tax=Hexamita inflata TaxID=28002 RepID=A0AA86PBH2_9EUKA|nr:Hypothetical protein HINF_LOCUS21280 [Hexamita inflata]
MKEIYIHTNLLVDILENNQNINDFSLTTSPVESQFGICKGKCFGKQTPQIMKGVVFRELKHKALFWEHKEQNNLPLQREKYFNVFKGNNSMTFGKKFSCQNKLVLYINVLVTRIQKLIKNIQYVNN